MDRIAIRGLFARFFNLMLIISARKYEKEGVPINSVTIFYIQWIFKEYFISLQAEKQIH